MTIDEMIAVLQAAKAGKQIQYASSGEWLDVIMPPLWDFARHCYRVKPEPREWHVHVLPSGGIHQPLGENPCCKCVKVREVL